MSGLTETLITIAIAFLIGIVNDKLTPKMYYYKDSIVTVHKKYQCPKWCSVEHYHYVHYDTTIVHRGGMVINKSILGKEYKPPKKKK